MSGGEWHALLCFFIAGGVLVSVSRPMIIPLAPPVYFFFSAERVQIIYAPQS
jgi:hypothetical protein